VMHSVRTQRSATPLMFCKWHAHDRCERLLIARSDAVTAACAIVACSETALQSVDLSGTLSTLASLSAVCAVLPVSSNEVSQDSSAVTSGASSSAPLRLHPASSNTSSLAGQDSKHEPGQWYSFVPEGRSKIYGTTSPLPLASSTSGASGPYAIWCGALDNASTASASASASDDQQATASLEISIRAKVDSLVACPRRYARFMHAFEQCSFTAEEIVASQSELLTLSTRRE